MSNEREKLITARRETVEAIEAELAKAQRELKEAEGAELGRLPNIRGGFYHIHSDSTECGIAYWEDEHDYDYPNKGSYKPCKKLVNHSGQCGFEDNTAY